MDPPFTTFSALLQRSFRAFSKSVKAFSIGINVEISFYRTMLDSLSIVPEVFRVNYDGKSYKTAGDQFLNKQMSDEMRENYWNKNLLILLFCLA